MPRLRSVQVQRFKRIVDAPFDLENINVLVGANNSGKSSIIQGLHFAVGILQTVFLTVGRLRQGATSLNPTELIYSPSDSVYALGHGGKLQEEVENAIRIALVLEDGRKCATQIRRGRARNVNVVVENPDVGAELGTLDHPFTIFSPGLAGISKSENLVSDGVLLRTLARGDANLVLRNILYRLWDKPEWAPFLDDLHEVFPSLDFRIAYRPETAEFIDVQVKAGDEWVPIELAGTGVLQATQILSYVHRFHPSLIVLDEPDSHLHPNNQRLLCALLRTISEERETQVLLTTHSRHVVDALASTARFLWVRNATVDIAGQDDEIGILLDIGALDIKERVGAEGTKVVVLTEDENIRRLEVLLESSGFDMAATTVLPYYGATAIKNLRPLVKMIQGTNAQATIVLHRDRDFLDDAVVNGWEEQVRNLRVEAFTTEGTDLESHFLDADYLAEANGVTQAEIQGMVDAVARDIQDNLVEKYVNAKIDIARRDGQIGSLNQGRLAVEAPKQLNDKPDRFRHGKMMLAAVRARFRDVNQRNLKDLVASRNIASDSLKTIARKVFGTRSGRLSQ